jgi:hypothetical protein
MTAETAKDAYGHFPSQTVASRGSYEIDAWIVELIASRRPV